jgi:histidinol phosphatase-like enzyme
VGKSIGIPTGGGMSFGGFSSLDQQVDAAGATAKDVIDESVQEILDHLADNPARFDTVYYCVNDPDRESDARKDLIGMGIFHIGRDVRVYITDQLKKIPEQVKNRAIALRAIERV